MDYTKITNLDPASIELEMIILSDIDRELHAQVLFGIAPGLGMMPEALIKLEETCRQYLLPWEQISGDSTLDYDKMYYDNIGRFKDEKEKNV